MDEQQGSSSSVDKDLRRILESRILESRRIHDHYSALVCQPCALTCNERNRYYQELLPPWDRLQRPAPLQHFKWLEELPPDMFEAVGGVAKQVYEECDSVDWLSRVVNYMLRRRDVL